MFGRSADVKFMDMQFCMWGDLCIKVTATMATLSVAVCLKEHKDIVNFCQKWNGFMSIKVWTLQYVT